MKESKIQAEIVQFLQDEDIFFLSVPNESQGRSVVAQMQLVAMGLKKGASDLIIVFPGRVIFMEVKTDDGKQSPAQVKFEKNVKGLGHDYYVVRSVADVASVLSLPC